MSLIKGSLKPEILKPLTLRPKILETPQPETVKYAKAPTPDTQSPYTIHEP